MQEATKRHCGNPAWVKGSSPNTAGRPLGCGNQLNMRRYRFALYLFSWETHGNRAEAARRAGYSPKSARFIACRIMHTPEVRNHLRELKRLEEELNWVRSHMPWLSMEESMETARKQYDKSQHFTTKKCP